MAKQDYIPASHDQWDTWLQTFTDNLSATGTALGIPVADTDDLKTEISTHRDIYTSWKNKKNEAQGESDKFKESRKSTESKVRAMANRFKVSPLYTTAQGELMGIEGPEETPLDPAIAKPKGNATAENDGVTIRFSKPREISAVRITCKRGNENSFSHVADDTNSPYFDARPNLADGAENREYKLQFLKDSQVFGQPSDVIKIAVG